MSGRDAVAHGTTGRPVPDDLPYIPDVFLLREGARFWSVERSTGKELDVGAAGHDHMLSSGEAVPMTEPVPWQDGRWAAVEESGLSFFDMGDEDRWRSDRARALLKEGQDMRGDPERALSMFRASGALLKIPVPKLVGYLERERKSRGENLADIYLRVKKP